MPSDGGEMSGLSLVTDGLTAVVALIAMGVALWSAGLSRKANDLAQHANRINIDQMSGQAEKREQLRRGLNTWRESLYEQGRHLEYENFHYPMNQVENAVVRMRASLPDRKEMETVSGSVIDQEVRRTVNNALAEIMTWETMIDNAAQFASKAAEEPHGDAGRRDDLVMRFETARRNVWNANLGSDIRLAVAELDRADRGEPPAADTPGRAPRWQFWRK